jgi:hypothetical protein
MLVGITKFLEASVLMENALKTAKPIVESVAKNSRNQAAKKAAAICLQKIETALAASEHAMVKNVQWSLSPAYKSGVFVGGAIMRHRKKYRYVCPNQDEYPTHHNFYWHVPLIVQIIDGGAQARCLLVAPIARRAYAVSGECEIRG